MRADTLHIQAVSYTGEVTVFLRNASGNAIRIWKESNSWGAAHWRVLLIRNGELRTFFENPDQDFTRNWPAFDEMAAGAHSDKKLAINSGSWRGLGGQRINFTPGDIVIAIYDVPFTQDSLKHGVWYGVVAASMVVR
jgi:hypothetical protein